jgi:hypothetical protein
MKYGSSHNSAWVLGIMSRRRLGAILGSRVFDGINLSFELFRGFLVFVEFALPEFGVRDPAL